MPYKTRILRKWCLVCLGLLAAALALSWLQGVAFAAQSESQLVGDTESENYLTANYNSVFAQTIATSTAWEALDTKIKVKIKNTDSVPHTYKAELGTFTPDYSYCSTNWNADNGDIASESIPAGETKIVSMIIGADTIQGAIEGCEWNILSAHYYRFFQIYESVDRVQFHMFGSATNVYSDGVFYIKLAGNATIQTSAYVADAYFEISPNIDLIDITFPANASTTPDFAAWKVDFLVKDTPPVYGSLKLNYGTSSSTLTSFDTLNFEAYDNEEAPANIPKSLLLLPYTTYYAQANILDASSTVIATSTLIYFNTTGVGEFYENNYYPIPTSTIATSTPIQITCDPDDPWYAYSLCKLAVWLFVPSPATLNQFTTLGDTLKNKPPMGYFYRIKDALVFSATSTPAFNLENASTTLAASIYNPLKTGITFLFWLVFGFWIFNRIRYLDL